MQTGSSRDYPSKIRGQGSVAVEEPDGRRLHFPQLAAGWQRSNGIFQRSPMGRDGGLRGLRLGGSRHPLDRTN